jgi:hypothetical protein
MDATVRQKVVIARLCMALKIVEPVEEKAMSRGEAGRLIRLMVQEVKARKEGCCGSGNKAFGAGRYAASQADDRATRQRLQVRGSLQISEGND